MNTVPFLKTIFPNRLEGAADLIRFAVTSADDPFPGKQHWLTRAELHALTDADIAALGFDTRGKDVYFTPHGFARRDERVTKIDAVPLLDAAWVELDDVDIPPETFAPPPSIAVNTSDGRYHLYWLLDAPLPAEEVQTINRRLTYGNGVKVDKGGWALTKWLRLPGTTSYKRQTPYPVAVVAVDGVATANRYAAADFDDLPLVPKLSTPPPTAAPNPRELPHSREVREKYALPSDLVDLLERRRSDRSVALWNIYRLCYHAGLSKEECFALVRGSPNDKFHGDWRYNADDGLWNDITRGYHMAHNPADAPVIAALRAERARQGMPVADRRRKMAEIIWDDIIGQKGRVFFDPRTREALFYNGTSVIPIDPTDRRWKVFINRNYHVCEGESDFRPINANLYAIAAGDAPHVVPRTFSYWNRQTHVLYVYNGGGVVYRLDGERIDRCENGVDDVFFLDAAWGEPWEAAPAAGAPILADAVLGLPNYKDDPYTHTREDAILLARLWLYALFFSEAMDARPHLVVTGPTDSGKTLVLKAIDELLVGPGAEVSTAPNDRVTFETVVSNAHHVFFDNVDEENGRRWLVDSLAEVATGIQFTRRHLYTTNESVSYRVQCYVGMTTREPWFSRVDVATRMIFLHTERRLLKRNPTDILDVIRANRAALWWETLTDLNKIVVALKHHQSGEHRLRMAGYADFIQAACLALGVESRGLIQTIQSNQSDSALKQSAVWTVLEAWLHEMAPRRGEADPVRYKNSGEWVATSRLHQELRGQAQRMGSLREYDRRVPNARSLSHQLREMTDDLNLLIDVEFRHKNPANQYRFTLRETPEQEGIAA